MNRFVVDFGEENHEILHAFTHLRHVWQKARRLNARRKFDFATTLTLSSISVQAQTHGRLVSAPGPTCDAELFAPALECRRRDAQRCARVLLSQVKQRPVRVAAPSCQYSKLSGYIYRSCHVKLHLHVLIDRASAQRRFHPLPTVMQAHC